MKAHHRKLVTLIAESALEPSIVHKLSTQPISGYTITDARGTGARGSRPGTTAETGNIRCEVVCREEVARQIAEEFLEEFGRNYALVVYVGDVTVLRADKF